MIIKRFEKANRFRAANRWLQGVLFGLACGLIFFLAWQRLPMIDLTMNGRYSLTPETTAYLQGLTQEVEIVGSLALGEATALGGDRLHELQSLTRRYADTSKKIKLVWVDGFRAQSEYGFQNPYQIRVHSADKTVWIDQSELYLAEDGAWVAERAITSALWKILNPAERRWSIVTTADRWNAEGSWGLQRLREFLASRNIVAEALPPESVEEEMPAADVIVWLAGNPTTAALASLQRAINDHKSHLLLAVDDAPEEALIRFMYFNGVGWPGLRVQEKDPKERTVFGEMLVRGIEAHPITANLEKRRQAVLSKGPWWALEPRKSMIDTAAWTLLKSSPSSTAEGGGKTTGPWVLMMALEKKTADGNTSRLVVCGSSHWLTNAYLGYGGNQTLLEGVAQWMSAGGNLMSIPAREKPARQLGLTSVQLWRMGGWISACALVLIGLGVLRWATRPK